MYVHLSTVNRTCDLPEYRDMTHIPGKTGQTTAEGHLPLHAHLTALKWFACWSLSLAVHVWQDALELLGLRVCGMSKGHVIPSDHAINPRDKKYVLDDRMSSQWQRR